MGRAKPLITANAVTLLRLLPMPAICWLIYQQHYWIALVLGTLVGSTDFVDGYLARKHGPTVLGGLMDPIADKVFIAFIYLPLCDPRAGSIFAAWAVALMFVREFVVTALRSAYEKRHLEMTTTYLAKTKTWVQMQAIGLAMLFVLLEQNRVAMVALLLTMAIAPLIAMAGLWIIKRKFWPGAFVMSAASAPLLFVHHYYGLNVILGVILAVILAITWASGFDYIRMGLTQLRGRDVDHADLVRIVGAIALPCVLFATLVLTPVSPWPLVAILSLELAVGGLDNLVSHHRAGAGAIRWGLRVVGSSLLLGLAMILGAIGAPTITMHIVVATACAVTAAGAIYEFWRGREFYLDRRLREKARLDAAQNVHHQQTASAAGGY